MDVIKEENNNTGNDTAVYSTATSTNSVSLTSVSSVVDSRECCLYIFVLT